MFTIFLNKAKTLLDVNAMSLQTSSQKKTIFDQNKMKWEMVLTNLKTDFNSTVSLLKQNELKLADAQASSAAWQNKAILALSQGLIELAKNAFVHKSYYDTYIKELLNEKEWLLNQTNYKKAELYKVKFRVDHMQKRSNNKKWVQRSLNGLVYKPEYATIDTYCSGERKSHKIDTLNYSHLLYQFD